MSKAFDEGDSPLVEDIRSAIVDLGRARQSLADDGGLQIDDILKRLDQVTAHIAEFDSSKIAKSSMLMALFDELEQTIRAFSAEREKLREGLHSTSRNMAAGIAYRRLHGG